MNETLTHGPRDKLHTVHSRLFQAAMWRKYARQWDAGDPWVEQVLRVARRDCIRRCRINAYLARRLNRTKANAQAGRIFRLCRI